MFKHLLLRKTNILKTCRKNLKKCTNFEEQKGTRYIREKIYFGIIIFSCLQLLSFVYKTVSQISFKLFCSGDKKTFIRFP